MAPIYKVKTAPKSEGGAEPVTKWKDKSAEQIFSDDDNEKKFIEDVCWIQEGHWILSEMKWNTIHGVSWKRNVSMGKGGWGSVSVGVREDKRLFAVKSINIEYPLTKHSKNLVHSQIAEIKMMRYLRSKYIVRCLGCGRSCGANGLNQKDSLDVFLELAVRGSLSKVYIKRKEPFEEDPYIRQYTYDLLKALQYMRKKRVVHGDIKMANVLLADDCVKLADWGGAKQLTESNLRRFLIGTRGFRGPEVLKHQQQSYPSDIFSLGCTVIQMFTGKAPTETLSKTVGVDQLFQPIMTGGRQRIKIPDKMSPECKDFLDHCVCPNIEDRWTAAELLHHPFIANRDKTSQLPYGIEVPKKLSDSILKPPRRLDPELPDETVTKRVYRHLTRGSVAQSWVANLAGCGQNDPPLYPPSPELRNPSPDPLPSLPLHFGAVPDPNLLQLVFFPKLEEFGPCFKEPSSSQHIIVESPVGSPQRESSGRKDDVDMMSVADQQDLIAEVKVPPAVEAKEFHDEMLNSANVMRAVNNDIYEEARLALERVAAQQPTRDPDPDHHSLQLFPQLKKARMMTTPETATRLPNWGLGMGCYGTGQAVEAVEPRQRKIPSPPTFQFLTPGLGSPIA